MRDAAGFRAWWMPRIERDLASFSDPGSRVELKETGRDLHAVWRMGGNAREADFQVRPSTGVRVQWNGDNLTYEQFLASDQLAHLRHVAKMTLLAGTTPHFVSTEARYDDDNGFGPSEPAVDLLRGLIEKPDRPATQVVMLTGEAGAGKTAVLRRLTEEYAALYLRGKADRLLLYVNAQGRALARLHEALATELQDLKVRLTYHSVATLARLGILVPVIDGFDELLGVSGYDDAFSSLSGFLDDLEGEGCVLASARSTYYEEEFVVRAGAVVGRDRALWTQVPVRVEGWSEDNRNEFLTQWATQTGLSEERKREIGARTAHAFAGQNQALQAKPFFFTKVVALLRERPNFDAGGDLLGQLVRAYLDRELTEKLLDRQSSPLLTEEQFDLLMRELAQEMWNLETRELDARSVREVAEYVAENENISETAKAVVVERMPSLAFLARSDRPGPYGRFAFEHEAFFFYFLAESIVSLFKSAEADIGIILGRSALPENVAERVARGIAERGNDSGRGLRSVMERLGRAGASPGLRTVQVRENAGRLALAILRPRSSEDASRESSQEVANVAVRNLTLPGGTLSGVTFRNCSFEEVVFRRTDLRRTRFLGCEVRNPVLFQAVRIDTETTRLDLRSLDERQFVGLRLAGGDEVTHDPSRRRRALATCGMAVPEESPEVGRSVDPQIVELLERLMRAYGRANPVCMQDDALRKLVSSPKWAGLKALLLEHEIVSRDRRETGGKKKEFLRRRFLPDQIMAGRAGGGEVHPQVRRFWRSVPTVDKPGGRRARAR